jgi:hypothetical protein
VGPINRGLDQPSAESFLIAVPRADVNFLAKQYKSAFINMAHRGVEKMRNQLGMVIFKTGEIDADI